MKYTVKIGYSVKGLKWIPVTFLSTIATRKKKKNGHASQNVGLFPDQGSNYIPHN